MIILQHSLSIVNLKVSNHLRYGITLYAITFNILNADLQCLFPRFSKPTDLATCGLLNSRPIHNTVCSAV
jgi:hypothetical protein